MFPEVFMVSPPATEFDAVRWREVEAKSPPLFPRLMVILTY